MVMRSPALTMNTRLNATRGVGFFAKVMAFFVALMRRVFGRETMFIYEFSGGTGGEVVLAPRVAGSIVHKSLTVNRLFVQAGSFLANAGDVQARLRCGGLRTLFGGEGLFLLECSGHGDVFVSSYGGIM